MYEIILTHRAIKDLERFDPGTRRRLGQKLQEYAVDPIPNARKLVDPTIGTYRFRIGDYRVIFDLVGTTIVVLRIGHRKEIYR